MAGLVIVGIGVFFLLAQFIPDIGRWIPLFIGLIFLAAFIPKREYGFLDPGLYRQRRRGRRGARGGTR